MVYAGTTADALCFTNSSGSCTGTTATITFGQTVDFFQPSGVALFDAHTATGGGCVGFTCTANGNFRVPSLSSPCGGGGHYFCNNVDSYVPFDGVNVPTGGSAPLNAGTYTYYCEPHGSGMTGTIQVNQASTSAALTVGSPNPSVVNQLVSFTVTVSNASFTGVTPTGTVTFFDGLTPISGALTLISGSRTFFYTFPLGSGGNHSITAVFNANTNFSGSASNTLVQQVQDFSINITNPAGAALPGVNYDYSGTLTAINGYSAAVNITCQNGATTPPNTCALLSPSNPVPMGTPFTVRASHPSAAPTFSFNIRAASASGFSDIQAFPVTLNVGSFTLNTLNPSSVSAVQGNPSNTTAFSVSALDAFSGPITMSCLSPPPGVTCFFPNGAATQVLGLGAGQTINDTLTLNTSSTLGAGPYSITVQASPTSGPSQTRNLTLNESTGTRANTFIYFGTAPTGTGQTPVNPSHTLLLNGPITFSVSALNQEAVTNSSSVNVTLVFAEPFKSASANVTFGAGSCSITSSVQISCSLGTITAASPWIKTITYSVVPFPGRTLDFTAFQTESNLNQTTFYRYRPMVRPGQNLQNTNPK